jgi:hypothetical protein
MKVVDAIEEKEDAEHEREYRKENKKRSRLGESAAIHQGKGDSSYRERNEKVSQGGGGKWKDQQTIGLVCRGGKKEEDLKR